MITSWFCASFVLLNTILEIYLLSPGMWTTSARGPGARPPRNTSSRPGTRWSSFTERSPCSPGRGTWTPRGSCRICLSRAAGTSWYQVTWGQAENSSNRNLLSGDYGSLTSVIEKSKKYNSCLLQIKFTSLSSYLWLLKLTSQLLSKHSEQSNISCLLYLAAAVSDFYVPASQLPVHKIQSSQVCS